VVDGSYHIVVRHEEFFLSPCREWKAPYPPEYNDHEDGTQNLQPDAPDSSAHQTWQAEDAHHTWSYGKSWSFLNNPWPSSPKRLKFLGL
jgi:hypothetical protein